MTFEHLKRYLNEITRRAEFRGMGTLDQMKEMVSNRDDKVLTYKRLTA